MSKNHGGKYSGMSKKQKVAVQKEYSKLSKHQQKESNDAYRKPIMHQRPQTFKSEKDYDRNKEKEELRHLEEEYSDWQDTENENNDKKSDDMTLEEDDFEL